MQNSGEDGVDITVVVPVLNEEQSVALLYQELLSALEAVGQVFELLFVDDGSTDGTYAVLERLHQQDARVKVIRFRRNFGKSAALA
ncbi:MAG: glycosyltransferase, partial [Chloroflexi bacterium]|nr:glycosyltransferase [Chloroflexota bacterium]